MARSRRLFQPLRTFLATETAGGVLLLAAAAVALVWANTPLFHAYESLWETHAGFSLGDYHLELNLHEWVNDGAMTLFFLVVGLEIKRELVQGELADRRRATLPVMAALGGVVVPALIFAMFAAGTDVSKGWGIPVATDIAMAIGVLKLAGAGRVPDSLTVFLLALAIVDDLVTILILIVFYSGGVEFSWLALAVASMVLMVVLKQVRVDRTAIYIGIGAALWLFLHEAHVHATLAGVFCGLLAPTSPALQFDEVDEGPALGVAAVHEVVQTREVARRSISVVERLEHALHPWTSFVVLPVFALSNAGIRFESELLSGLGGSALLPGIVLGAVLGKPIGISAAVWLSQKVGIASMPTGVRWPQLISVAALGGIGFTVAIFIANSSFDSELLVGEAKLAVLLAALVAAVLGSIAVRSTSRGPADARH
ncbi:MAG: Na+/H+ antiporter NhaA [Ilumatobacteraceae bacterium]